MASALLAFRAALRGATGTQLGTWSGSTCVGWAGVTCSAASLPTALSLGSLGLTGTLSCDLATVTSLTSVTLVRGECGKGPPKLLVSVPACPRAAEG
jgi:hypothetical protein